MKLLFTLLTIAVSGILAQDARNIMITTDGLIIATQRSGGLLLQRGTSLPTELSLPSGVASFDDISIAEEGMTLFALSTSSRAACSYARTGDSFDLVGCVAPGFAVSPFSGISARDGACVISGGTGGFTILDYSIQTALLDPIPRVLNMELAPNVVGHPDVQLINGDFAALSTDFADSFSGLPRFGTSMVDLNSLSEVRNFRVSDSLGFSLVVGATNFPLVNTIYENTVGSVVMFTANGGITVQDPFNADSTVIIEPSNTLRQRGFRAVSVSADRENELLAVGGILDGSQSIVLQFSLSADPFNPSLTSETEVTGRITSVAANGGTIAYVASDVDGVGLLTSDTPLGGAPVSAEEAVPAPATGSPTTSPVFSPDVNCACQNGGQCASSTLRQQNPGCICLEGFQGPLCERDARMPASSSGFASSSLFYAGLLMIVWWA